MRWSTRDGWTIGARGVRVDVSDDGVAWTEGRVYTEADGLPPPADSNGGSDGDELSSLSPAAFSLALAGRVEHESLADAQALLESRSTSERLAALDTALAEAATFTSTQLMLKSLGSLGLGG